MSADQNQTTSTPKEQKLCRLGCGFFGSNATGDCCSKCWNDMKNKKEGVSSPAPIAVVPKQIASSSTVVSSSISSSKNPVPTSDDKAAAKPSTVTTADMMDVDAATQQPAKMDISKAPTIDGAEKIVVAAPAHTKKKKKKSYKSLVAGMMEGNKDRVKSEEKDNIKKVTGGGAFVKIDKI